MKTRIFPLLLALVIKTGAPLAAPRTVVLDVQNMTCAVCPLTVKKALEYVSSVRQVTVDYASKTATVEFDDAATAAEKLTEATKAAGYPSTIRQDKQ
jgi:mercuric ion binding protein